MIFIKPKLYPISAHSYLQRAKKCLSKNKREYLFYAAFELRCGVESRMQEYLASRAEVSNKQKDDWRIGRLGKSIQNALKVTNKIAILNFYSEDRKPLVTLRFIPVSKKLQEMAEKLGDLLHAQRDISLLSNEWWKNTRSFLAEVFDELDKACSGTILAPPLRHSKTGLANITIVPNHKDFDIKKFKKLTSLNLTGKTFYVDISYEDL